jgi:hypothetical protein|tara:strand:+ start:614 stop:862 length:249 start_codon:yes stop_codon:yes gene_type:complete
MIIEIFCDKDIKKSGGYKLKNDVVVMKEQEFINYVKDSNLLLSKGYIDLVGFLSNNKKFKCYNDTRNLIIGVTGIIDKINEG